MGANETPDRSHASGTFVPVVSAPFTEATVNSSGVNSFTRNGPGNYTVGLTSALAFAEGIAAAKLPANFLGVAGAQIAPDGGSVLVTVFDLQGAPADPPIISLDVTSVEQGEGEGPAPDLPTPPVAPASTGLAIGWVRVNASAAIIAQSASAIIESVAPWAGNPGVSVINLVAGTVAGAALASQDQAQQSGVEWMAQVLTPTRVHVQAGIGDTPTGRYYCVIFGL